MAPYLGYDSDTTFIPGTLNTSSSLTIQGGGITQTGGDVNFDSGTLFIDEDLNRVGIGITTPGETLTVDSGTSVGQVIVSRFRGNASGVNGQVINVLTSNLESGAELQAYSLSTTNSTGALLNLNDAIVLRSSSTTSGGIAFTTANSTAPLIFATDSSERFRITPTGNVGIGTTNPGQKLVVQNGGISVKGAVTPNINFEPAGIVGNADISFDGTTFGLVSNSTSASLTLSTSSTERLRISSTGNVGIGTTNPAQKLHVYGSGDVSAIFKSTNAGAEVSLDATNGYAALRIFASGTETWRVGNAGQSSSFQIHQLGVGDRLTINNSGNVGVGSTNPSFKLDVVGTLRATGESRFDNGINLKTATLNYVYFDDAIAFSRNGVGERIRINSSGNVGIGTTNPGYTLDVQGSQNVTTQISLWGRTIGQPQTLIEPGKIYATAAGLGPGNLLLQPTGGNIGIGTDSPSQILHVHAPGTDLAVIRLSGTANLQTPYNIRQGITGVSNAGFSIFDVTSATTRFAIDSAGNIGIGTGNPVSILHVESATPGVTLNTTANNGTTSITFNETGSNAARLSVSGDYLDSIIELENYSAAWASTGLVVRGNNVGIGITTPQNVLDLGSATNNRGISWGGTGANYANIWTEYSTASIHIGQGVRPTGTSTGWVSSTGISSVGRSVIKLNFNTGDIGFHTTTPVTVADGSVVTVDQRMVIAGTGNVGIGTANPTQKLHVVGLTTLGGILNNVVTISNDGTYTSGSGAGTRLDLLYGGLPIARISNTGSGVRDGWFSLFNEGTSTVNIAANASRGGNTYFNNGGNVGIGTTDPVSKLHIIGSTWSNTAGGDIVVSNSSAVGAAVTLRPTNSTSFSTGWSLYTGASASAIGDGSVGFWNHTTQKDPVRIDQSDNLHIRYANLVFGTTGRGIDFSANPNPSGMTSELLNDYEEGTWTPVWQSTGTLPTLTYSTQSGYYVKIGRVVHFWGRIYMAAWGGGGGSGNIRVGGLPFTSNSDSNHGGPLCQVTFSYSGGNAVWPSGASQVFARVLNGSTSIEYISLGVPTTQLGEIGVLQWTPNPQMYNNYFSGSYFV